MSVCSSAEHADALSRRHLDHDAPEHERVREFRQPDRALLLRVVREEAQALEALPQRRRGEAPAPRPGRRRSEGLSRCSIARQVFCGVL